MIPGRSLLCLLTSGLLLLSQLHVWGATGCSMCGSSCHCASRASGAPCSVRSVGCGGGGGVDAIGSVGPLRAVLVTAFDVTPRFAFDRARAEAAQLPPQPARPPLVRPPRVSC